MTYRSVEFSKIVHDKNTHIIVSTGSIQLREQEMLDAGPRHALVQVIVRLLEKREVLIPGSVLRLADVRDTLDRNKNAGIRYSPEWDEARVEIVSKGSVLKDGLKTWEPQGRR